MRKIRILLVAVTCLCVTTYSLGQVKTYINDGYTGIVPILTNDTVEVTDVIRNSPADEAGIRSRDRIMAINGKQVSGAGINLEEINGILNCYPGESFNMEVLPRKGDSLVRRYFTAGTNTEKTHKLFVEYLPDSLERWTIRDILGDSLSHSFKDPTEAKLLVHSVDTGSIAMEQGIIPGDRLISLYPNISGRYHSTIEHGYFSAYDKDTVLVIRRDSMSLTLPIDLNKRTNIGINSQYLNDLQGEILWYRVTMVNRITEDREYLLQLNFLDSGIVYQVKEDGVDSTVISNKIPPSERKFLYQGEKLCPIRLVAGSEQILYLKAYWIRADDLVDENFLLFSKTRLVRFDGIERLILGGLLGILLFMSLYYLIIFIFSREIGNLFYSLCIFFSWILIMDFTGYLAEREFFFILRQKHIYQLSVVFAGALIFYNLFAIRYLELKRHLRVWYRIIISLVITTAVFFLFVSIENLIISDEPEWLIIILGILLSLLFVFSLAGPIIPSILMIRKGYQPAWYFLIASCILIILFSVQTFRFFGVVAYSKPYSSDLARLLMHGPVPMAAVLQFIIFSIGLARKMRLDEQEKQLAQERVIEQLKENEKLKDKVNRELEHKVRERTKEISEQKEEIEAQRDEIEAQRDLLQEQKDLVVAQKQELTDSITYAQRIQAAVLPRKAYLDKVMPEYFVLFRPRDIVSGDFYWVREVKNYLVVVAADCTGHGVPGAFMSMLGISLLNEVVGGSRFDRPGEILNRLRNKVKDTLAQEGHIHEQKDGMDMALAILDKESLELQYAGAYNPLYIFREKDGQQGALQDHPVSLENDLFQLFELKADRQPISIHEIETDFTTRTMQLQRGDSLYAFSDGFVDQKGGLKRKKFLSKNFKRFLLEIQPLAMKEQEEKLAETLDEWMKEIEQIDDILVMGIRV